MDTSHHGPAGSHEAPWGQGPAAGAGYPWSRQLPALGTTLCPRAADSALRLSLVPWPSAGAGSTHVPAWRRSRAAAPGNEPAPAPRPRQRPGTAACWGPCAPSGVPRLAPRHRGGRSGARGARGPGTARGRFHLSPRRSRRQQPSRKRPRRGSRGRRRGRWGAGEGEAREGMGLAARQRRHPAAAARSCTPAGASPGHIPTLCPSELGQLHRRDADGTSLWVQQEDPMALGHIVSHGHGAPWLWCPQSSPSQLPLCHPPQTQLHPPMPIAACLCVCSCCMWDCMGATCRSVPSPHGVLPELCLSQPHSPRVGLGSPQPPAQTPPAL